MKGADHLDFIIQHRLFRPRSTPTLEDLYDEVAPDSPDFNFVTAAQVEEKTVPEEKVILTRESHVKISSRLEVPELSGEIERAVWQVDQALQKGEQQVKSPPKARKRAERVGRPSLPPNRAKKEQ